MNSIISELEQEHSSILHYWIDYMHDDENGGFYGERDSHNNIVRNAPKGAILNGRMLWSFSSGYLAFHKPVYREAADRVFNFIINYLYDNKNGGFYWSVNPDGTPLDTKKQAYAEGFIIYGLSEYYRATGSQKALSLAVETYELLEKHFLDTKEGGYIEARAADWTDIADLRLSEKEENTPKTMNTHLHIIEPYVNLYKVQPSEKLKMSINHLLDIFASKIIDPKTGHFNLFFEMDWKVKSEIDSYGHDIEGAWLLYEAAEVIEDEQWMNRLKPLCKRLVDVTLEEGLDGGNAIFYEKVNGHLDTDKHWWPQAEAMCGLADTWRLTGDAKYYGIMLKVWNFIKAHISAPRAKGEWIWRVDKDGVDKYDDCLAGFWKCPYHNSRAMLEVIHRIKMMQ
ncbi:MAG: AGE family epimerase/isomerase [Marinilabiliaceae bacterium]|nr:AGE family epimerase/isomerase [Marinilabiliaceae bacterium]